MECCGDCLRAIGSLEATRQGSQVDIPDVAAQLCASPPWPDGARPAISFPLRLRAGGQPLSDAGGIISEPIETGLPDLPTNALFRIAVYKGISALIGPFDPHEAAAHGPGRTAPCSTQRNSRASRRPR